jgi:nucleotide-binding universal stress UspA family protein
MLGTGGAAAKRAARCAARIVIGFNGSKDAGAAVEAVALRCWPAGSEARLIAAHEPPDGEVRDLAVNKLRAAGLLATEKRKEGDTAHVLIKEAEAWGADSIFVGTRDVHGLKHLLHGSVSSAVAARALCSVEVVRQAKGAALPETRTRGAYAHAR